MAERRLEARDQHRWDVTDLIIPLGCIFLLWQAPGYGLSLIPAGVICVVLEHFAPYKPQKPLRLGWLTDVYHALITWTMIIPLVVGAVLLINGTAEHLFGGALAALRSQPVWLIIVEALLLGDLSAYGEHRLCHKLPLLWRFHRIHHIGEELDWLSRYRIHPVDAALLTIVEIVPFYILGAPAWAMVMIGLIVAYDGTLSHSNINLSLGPLWWIIKNPEYHRWHHAKDATAENRNFCELLPIWDVIFKTAYLPRDRKPEAYGVPDNYPINYVDQLLAPIFRRRRPDNA